MVDRTYKNGDLGGRFIIVLTTLVSTIYKVVPHS